jgi:CheY-like chemotaxis protein
LVQGYLEGLNLTVVEAESGDHALRLLGIGNFPDPGTPVMNRPGVILMDIRMPGMDGYETTRRIRESPSYKDAPIIAFTACAMKEEEERALSIFDGFIRKPAGKAQILEALRNHLPCKPETAPIPDAETPAAAVQPTGVQDRHPDIANRIEAELLPDWREIMDLFFIDDVAGFARKVDRFALRRGIGPLSDYARKLLASAEALDVETMNRLMADFERFVEEMVG